jgi:RNA polymerase sigma-70 factor (ECF subfamily)
LPPPPASALAEQELADRARDGDEQALGELFHRHAAQLHRHAWRMLRDEAAAGDVVQEAFLRAITAIPRTR